MLLPDGHSAAPPPLPKAGSQPTLACMIEYLPQTVLFAVRFQLTLVSKLFLSSRCAPLARKLDAGPGWFGSGIKSWILRAVALWRANGTMLPANGALPAPAASPVFGS